MLQIHGPLTAGFSNGGLTPSTSRRAEPIRLPQWEERDAWTALDDLDACQEAVAPARPAYLMALPTKIDPMLGYLTTGFHGLHVVAGLVAFLFVLARSYASRRYGHEQATAAIVTSYYWHFVDVVWIALFFMIYILK